MTLIRYSNGGFSHEDVMNLTFSQFYVYHDALTYCLNAESKEGQAKNDKKDRVDEAKSLSGEEVDDIKRKVAQFKERLSLKKSNGRQESS